MFTIRRNLMYTRKKFFDIFNMKHAYRYRVTIIPMLRIERFEAVERDYLVWRLFKLSSISSSVSCFLIG